MLLSLARRESQLLYIACAVFVVCSILSFRRGLRDLDTNSSIEITTLAAQHTERRLGYATFLSNPFHNSSDYHNYLEAVRLLLYQLKFDPRTRSSARIPVLVICTTSVSQADQIRLRQWGADIVSVYDPVIVPWAMLNEARWQDVMTKIHLHDFASHFDRILFVDADTILTRPLDGVFSEPEVAEEFNTLPADPSLHIIATDAKLPSTFVFAGVHDMKENHHWPPVSYANGDYWGSDDYLNAGFYVIKPDPVMLAYYRSLIAEPDRFPPYMPEQGLFNYAHRQYGRMPWQVLNHTWNMHYPTLEDLEGGVASLHDRWWRPSDKRLSEYIEEVRKRADSYYGESVGR